MKPDYKKSIHTEDCKHCPYVKIYHDKWICTKLGGKTVDGDKIDPDCDLEDYKK